jgi:hypothetical protein
VTSLREGSDELLTFFSFPKMQWKTLRTTNTIERLHEEFRRRVKTQGSLPSEDAALVLLFSLVASGQIKLRRINGWRKIAAVISGTCRRLRRDESEIIANHVGGLLHEDAPGDADVGCHDRAPSHRGARPGD